MFIFSKSRTGPPLRFAPVFVRKDTNFSYYNNKSVLSSCIKKEVFFPRFFYGQQGRVCNV